MHVYCVLDLAANKADFRCFRRLRQSERRKEGERVTLDAKQKETVEQIIKMLDGYRAEEIQKILYWVNTCCDSGYVLRAEAEAVQERFRQCE